MAALSVVVGDITQLDADAIVNAANEQLMRGGGVCGAIFRAAGPQLDAACEVVAPCLTGEARITPGFQAKAKWIVHAVGPIWHGGNMGEAELLASSYRSSLECAKEAGATSIAFPAISTGIFGYPRDQAADIAVATVRAWYETESVPERVLFCCYSEDDGAIYRARLG